MSVMEKARAADVFIWCGQFQTIRHGWVNRNKLVGGTPLTVPLDHRDWGGPIAECRIGNDARWRAKITKTLMLRLGEAAHPYCEIIERPWQKLVGLNMALLRQLCADLKIETEWVDQAHLETGGGNPMRAYLGQTEDHRPVSERLAMMVAELGANVWLSGPSGRGYLDESPFNERGIEVRYFDWPYDNPSSIEAACRPERIAA